MYGGGRRGYACKYASTAAASIVVSRLVMATMTTSSSLCARCQANYLEVVGRYVLSLFLSLVNTMIIIMQLFLTFCMPSMRHRLCKLYL